MFMTAEGVEVHPARGGEALDSRKKRGTPWGESKGQTAGEGEVQGLSLLLPM